MSDEILQSAIHALEERYGARLSVFREQSTLWLEPDRLVDAARTLRDEYHFDMMVDVTAVDYWPQNEPRFNVIYQLRSLSQKAHLQLRVAVSGANPNLPTVEGVYPSANWYEREIWDLFGVRFDGHSDLRRIVMPYDWEGHPLRKDYPTGYEEVAFTFNVEEIDLRKPRGLEQG